MLADFQNSFTVVFSKTFATKPMPHCPPHFRCVAALPCSASLTAQAVRILHEHQCTYLFTYSLLTSELHFFNLKDWVDEWTEFNVPLDTTIVIALSSISQKNNCKTTNHTLGRRHKYIQNSGYEHFITLNLMGI